MRHRIGQPRHRTFNLCSIGYFLAHDRGTRLIGDRIAIVGS
ncbi:hypothetical protein [Nostoc sp.]